MNILFLIGNGFDLNIGLKTRYCDFYEHYNSIETSSNNLKKLKDDIANNITNWSDLELALGKHTDKVNSIEEFDEVFEDISNKLADYLEEQEASFDFNKINYTEFLRDLYLPESSLLQADKNKISSFKENWRNNQWNVNIITFNYTRCIEKILGDYEVGTKIGMHDLSVPVVLNDVKHIHGYVDSRMILGVNDVTQISNINFRGEEDILDALVKPNRNQVSKETIDDACKKYISSANLICIFGSSIGATDNIWWNLLGQQLLAGSHSQLIIFNKGDENSPRLNYLNSRAERRVKENFLQKVSLTEKEKAYIREKIFVGINTKMFSISS